MNGDAEGPHASDDGEPLFESDGPRWPGIAPEQDDTAASEQLYATLNVSRDATADEIVKAYKALALVLHPDKQPLGLREAAQLQFARVQKAYEVLHDTHRRAAYDLLGEEGLKTDLRVSTHRAKSAAEMRAELQSQAFRRYRADIDALVKAQSEITCIVDGRALVANTINGQTPSLAERLSYVSRRSLALQHSFQVPLDAKTGLTVKASAVQRPQGAGGEVHATVRRTLTSKTTAELGLGLLQHTATLKFNWTRSKTAYLSSTSVLSLARPPLHSFTWTQQEVLPGLTGFCSLKSLALGANATSSRPSIALGLTHGPDWHLQADGGASGAALSGNRKITAVRGVTVDAGFALSTSGALGLTLIGESRVTTLTRVALLLTAPLVGRGAIVLRVRISRLGQRVTVPVILCDGGHLTLTLGLIAAPTLSLSALHLLWLQPRRRLRKEKKLAALREQHWEELERRKQEALDATELLRPSVARKVEQERKKAGGLLIQSATYGTAENKTEVTIAIQALVVDSVLLIPGGRSKASLLAFYDPAPGDRAKRLRIRYTFRGREHEAEWDDLAAVAVPQRSHFV